MSALIASGLNLSFGNTLVLEDFSLQLNQGEILCLLGPSGCGKTSALKTIAGLHQNSSGTITLFGHTVADGKKNLPPQQRHIGFIFQDYALFPHMTVAQNIAYGLRQLSCSEQQQRIREVLQLVKLSDLETRYPHELSGGQQQRIALARALAAKPRLLLMDEPFSNVDAQVKRRMMADLRNLLKCAGISVIFVTHAKDEAFAFADKTAVMIHGNIQQYATPDMVYNQPKNLEVARFMESGNLCDAAQASELVENACIAKKGTALFKRHLLTLEKSDCGIGIMRDIQFNGRGYLITIEFPGLNIDNWQAEMDALPECETGDKVRLSYNGDALILR